MSAWRYYFNVSDYFD